jgi:hypothetical protein
VDHGPAAGQRTSLEKVQAFENRNQGRVGTSRRVSPVLGQSPETSTATTPVTPGQAHAWQHAIGNRAFSAAVDQGRRTPLASVQRAQQGQQAEQSQSQESHAQQPQGQYEGLSDRERELSVKYGIRIGPAPGSTGPHFSSEMLKRIDAALKTLPPGDLGRNDYLTMIALHKPEENGEGSESVYNPDTRSIGMVRPKLPGLSLRMPQRIWASLSRDSGLQRWFMDQGVIAGLGTSRQDDRALGIRPGARHVMGGTSNALAHGNLIKWTVRHETGHAVELLAKWLPQLSREPRFGGWRSHGEGPGIDEVARAALARANLGNAFTDDRAAQAVNTLSGLLNAKNVRANSEGETSRLRLFLRRYEQQVDPDELAIRGERLTKFVRLAISHPWTLDDGGAGTLRVNGRIYQIDRDGEWASYSAGEREYAVSNYQFSSASEWFAEAYAAYYSGNTIAVSRLRPEVRNWFAERYSGEAGSSASGGDDPRD